ncbi:MAG: hypothetical protein KAH84_10555 [Thiomargarita sp.]|nr:hypothetical protein [Thiomargarita sp.]
MFKFISIIFIYSITIMGQAAENAVIIQANVHSDLKVGQLVNIGEIINLPELSELTLLYSNGEIKTIKGSYQDTLIVPTLNQDKNYPQLITALADFLIEKNENLSTLPKLQSGLDKNISLATELSRLLITENNRSKYQSLPMDLWLVDVNTNTRSYCISPTINHIILWRPKQQSAIASTLSLKHQKTGNEVKIVWPANQTKLNWPNKELSVYYNDTYTIELKNHNGSGPFFKKLILYKLPESLPSNSHKVVWMVGRGCISQANILLANLK